MNPKEKVAGSNPFEVSYRNRHTGRFVTMAGGVGMALVSFTFSSAEATDPTPVPLATQPPRPTNEPPVPTTTGSQPGSLDTSPVATHAVATKVPETPVPLATIIRPTSVPTTTGSEYTTPVATHPVPASIEVPIVPILTVPTSQPIQPSFSPSLTPAPRPVEQRIVVTVSALPSTGSAGDSAEGISRKAQLLTGLFLVGSGVAGFAGSVRRRLNR